MNEQLRQAYQRYIDMCHVIDHDPMDYAEWLEKQIEHIRECTEGLRYAIRENPPRNMDDAQMVYVHIHDFNRGWLEVQSEIPMTVRDLKWLLYVIYDDFPVRDIPPYEA